MTDPVEGQLRGMMGRLSELAPMAPAPEELCARERPSRQSSRRHLTWLTLAAVVAVVGVAVTLAPIGNERSTKVATDGAGGGPIDVRLEDLVVSYVPEGFTLEDDRTESIPASVVPDPQAPGRGVPQGSAGTMRTQRYNRGDAPGGRAVVYVSVVLRPDLQTLADLESQLPNPQPTSVGQNQAVLSVQEQGASGLIQFRWVQSPHVVVMLTGRGPVSTDEVRGMAEGVRFDREPSFAAPAGAGPGTASETPARAPGSVRVLVANGTATAGLAGRTRAPLLAAGYDAQRVTDALRPSSTSAVHFRPGFAADARAVADVLGIPETSIDPSPPLVADPSDADVVVVLGEDFVNASVSSPTAPTTTAPDTPAQRLQASAIRLDGFGPMFVGMPLDNAVRLYGQGGRIGQPPPCSYLAYTDGGATVLLTASSGDRFDLVTVRGGTFMTDSVIRIGSSLADLTRTYGEVDLHGRMSSINGQPSSSGQMVYLPSSQPAYAIAFELQQGIVVAIRAGSRDRVTAAEPC